MQIAISLLCAVCLTVASAECFRVLQSASYRPERGYFKVYFSLYFCTLAIAQIAVVLLDIFVQYSQYINLAILAVLATIWSIVKRKCPLKLTKRLLRMFVVETVILCILCVFVSNIYWVWLLPLFVLLSWAVCLPIDVVINKRYVKLAQKKLLNSGVTVIAITGSYGKTSVKDMLSALLCDSLAPKGSCNTHLGIAKFINGTELSGTRYLVLEFGARQRHDIEQLCKLYKPQYGIVTGICAQHLSTFKTIDNVIATKGELVEHLPADGFCVLNQSDGYTPNFLNSGVCKKYLSYDGIELAIESVSFYGTQLSLKVGDGDTVKVRLPQISDYVKDTFAMCLQMTLQLNQNFATTLTRIENIRQTPHRMELIKGPGCYVLDDSYNGSVVGVESCCKTLSQFHCPKVVITQGLVECGSKRKNMNMLCGQLLGKACDVAVVLGRNSKYLIEGLQTTNCKVLTAKDLNQAVQLAAPHARGGVLLFQNDLPDTVTI